MSKRSNKDNYENPSRIIGIQFSQLSPEEIRKNSVVEITSGDTYNNNKPVVGGLFDPRMGVLDHGKKCPTDQLDNRHCPGYFGHIELARPVYFMQHIKEIRKISQCVCFRCSRLLISKEQHAHVKDMKPEDRWDYVYKESAKVQRCGDLTDDGCGCKQPGSIKLEDIKDSEIVLHHHLGLGDHIICNGLVNQISHGL